MHPHVGRLCWSHPHSFLWFNGLLSSVLSHQMYASRFQIIFVVLLNVLQALSILGYIYTRMGAAGCCLRVSLPSFPSLCWANFCFSCIGDISAGISIYRELICVTWAEPFICSVGSQLVFWAISTEKEKYFRALRPAMRFQTTPTPALDLQQSRQCQVAGKHRALQPEQATSSQQHETFLSPVTQRSVSKQRN